MSNENVLWFSNRSGILGSICLSSSGRLALDARHFYCDLTEFDKLYLEHTWQSFQHAVSLYKGPVLLEPAYDWAMDQGAYYDTRCLEMLEFKK